MSFITTWFTGYHNPIRFADNLRNRSASFWGLYAQILRGLLDSFFIYLPAALLGWQPHTPSFLTFIPIETYYRSLIFLSPLVFLVEWLLGAIVIHVFIRLCKKESDIDQILNITGLAGLVIAAFLVIWDWFWFFIGFSDQYFLGISHLVIDIWWFVLVVYCFKRILGLPVYLSIIGCLLAFIFCIPYAVIIMRAPF